MSAKIPLRTDYDAVQARALARKATDPNQVRRLLAIAAVYAGMNRRDAAAVGPGGRARSIPSRASAGASGSPSLARHENAPRPPVQTDPQ